MAHSTILILLGTILVTFGVMVNMNRYQYVGVEATSDHYGRIHARNMAASTANIMLAKLADSSDFRAEQLHYMLYYDAVTTYRVVDTVLTDGDDLIKISAAAEYHGNRSKVDSYFSLAATEGWIPPMVRAAWTANAVLNNIIGDMEVDGRNSDLEGSIIASTGVYGVSTGTDFYNDHGAHIGGTRDSIDYSPAFPESFNVVEENYDWEGNFPESPDAVLGLPDSTLKNLALSGAGGSQYVFVDEAGDLENALTFPLSGITYIDVDPDAGAGHDDDDDGGGDDDDDGDDLHDCETTKNGKKVIICHVPPGNPENAHTITISVNALKNHLDHHDDYCGPCGDGGGGDDGGGGGGDDDDDDDEGHGSSFEIDFVFQGSGNSGILIVHAPGATSRVRSFESQANSPFSGLIVTDYSFHHHIDILGAIFQLSPEQETSESCTGNQSHWVRYSAKAISDATVLVIEETDLVVEENYRKAFGKNRQKQQHRWE